MGVERLRVLKAFSRVSGQPRPRMIHSCCTPDRYASEERRILNMLNDSQDKTQAFYMKRTRVV